MSEYKINMGLTALQKNMARAAKKIEPHSQFVGYLDAGKGAPPAFVFWCPQPREGYENHYFGIVTLYDCAKIIDASSVAEGTWAGLLHVPSGEVIFSRYRHDFREFSFGGPAVDGGRDYVRIVGDLTSDYRQVQLRCVDGKFKVIG